MCTGEEFSIIGLGTKTRARILQNAKQECSPPNYDVPLRDARRAGLAKQECSPPNYDVPLRDARRAGLLHFPVKRNAKKTR
jgi:hypothetical protein